TDLQSGSEFLTDSSGREMLKRVLNYRPTWNLSIAEKVAGNYYPVNTRIMIQDESRQLSLFNDRSQGGSSLAPGRMEVMLHRRILHDDAFGKYGDCAKKLQFEALLRAKCCPKLLITRYECF